MIDGRYIDHSTGLKRARRCRVLWRPFAIVHDHSRSFTTIRDRSRPFATVRDRSRLLDSAAPMAGRVARPRPVTAHTEPHATPIHGPCSVRLIQKRPLVFQHERHQREENDEQHREPDREKTL